MIDYNSVGERKSLYFLCNLYCPIKKFNSVHLWPEYCASHFPSIELWNNSSNKMMIQSGMNLNFS